MCGDHGRGGVASGVRSGSSPHVRGPPRVVRLEGHRAGIIPACAGTTRTSSPWDCSTGDYPRMCGDHSTPFAASCAVTGSSPHVRGPPLSDGREQLRLGIIPACAGTTALCRQSRTGSRDHPRMCGDHRRRRATTTRWPGSSPHVRGPPFLLYASLLPAGIIPACAGTTLDSLEPRLKVEDHPRMCGDHRTRAS